MYPFSEAYLRHIEPEKAFKLMQTKAISKTAISTVSEEDAMNGLLSTERVEIQKTETDGETGIVNGESEAMDVPLRPEEKKRLNWEGGRYLAPLTTVGNLVSLSSCLHRQLISLHSHFDGFVCTTARRLLAAKWLWPNLSSWGTLKSGLLSAVTSRRRCLECN